MPHERSRDGVDPATRDKLEAVENRLAAANSEIGAAVEQSTGMLSATHLEFQLRNTHNELLDAYRELIQTIDMVERTLGEIDEHAETPKQITSDHSERIGETYDEPLSFLAIQLLQSNRRKWLHRKPETNGTRTVRRHGPTSNQRTWLNDIQALYSGE
jgi:Na+/phosphate symporter